VTFPTPMHPAVTVRLRVQNRRRRHIDLVRVAVREVRRVDALPLPDHFVDFLKWMHDDTPDHPESISGIALAPDECRYVDLATKILPTGFLVIEYARPHLRNSFPLPAAAYYLLIEGTARDAETRRRAPARLAAFELSVGDEGGLEVSPRSLGECGFATGRDVKKPRVA
jgi:hypothetical protein